MFVAYYFYEHKMGTIISEDRLRFYVLIYILYTSHPLTKHRTLKSPFINQFNRKNVNPSSTKGPVQQPSMPSLKLYLTTPIIDSPLRIQMRSYYVVPLDIRRMNSSYNVNVLPRMKL